MSALLRHLATSSFPGGYRSDYVVEPWLPGEDREVDPHVAVYLATEHPESFEVLRAPDRADLPMPEPTLPDEVDPADLAKALDQKASDLVYPIRGGVYDAHLPALWLLERAGGNRKTVIDALLARAGRIHLTLDPSAPPPTEEPPAPSDDVLRPPSGG